MADVETPAAAPSPAAETATPEPKAPASDHVVPTDPEAYARWRQTGKLPGQPDDKPSKGEGSAPSGSGDEESSEKGAPVSETGHKGRDNAETRIKRLLSERDEYKAKLDALEAGKKDASGTSSPAPAKDGKAESSPAAGALERPVRPKEEDFEDWAAYRKAEDKYLEDLADYKAAQRLEAHTQRQRQEALSREMQSRLDAATERYGAEAESKITSAAKTVFEDRGIPQDLKTAMGRSEVIVDALYVIGSDAEELKDFLHLAKSDPLEALRKWFTVEGLVREELKNGAGSRPNGATARGPDGKFVAEKPEKPAKREAPSPPRELGGTTSPPGDERDRAAKNGDFLAFKADADRRDAQRFRGQ